jgi:hypothetical protein
MIGITKLNRSWIDGQARAKDPLACVRENNAALVANGLWLLPFAIAAYLLEMVQGLILSRQVRLCNKVNSLRVTQTVVLSASFPGTGCFKALFCAFRLRPKNRIIL